MDHQLALTVLEESLAVCSLPPGYPLPEAIFTGSLSAVIQTEDEISLICRSDHIPHGATAVAGWRAFKVQGPLEFELTGVLASLALPLAQHGVSIFAISTYETDYILVREDSLAAAIDALLEAGHTVEKE
jgi:hypothetical protein